MANPQQPEAHRTGRGASDSAGGKSTLPGESRARTGRRPPDPGPEAGHHPPAEQDRLTEQHRPLFAILGPARRRVRPAVGLISSSWVGGATR